MLWRCISMQHEHKNFNVHLPGVQKNVPLVEDCPSPKGTFFLGHPVWNLVRRFYPACLRGVQRDSGEYGGNLFWIDRKKGILSLTVLNNNPTFYTKVYFY